MHAPGLALPALVLGALCIGMAPVFVRLADVGPTAAAFWRVALATPVLLALWWPRRQALSWRLLWPGVFFGCDLAVWHQAIHHTSVANATLLPNLQPVFVTAVMVLWFGERLRPAFFVGLALALAGAAILLGDSLSLGGGQWLGDMLGIVTAMFYAAYLISVARLRGSHTALGIMWVASAVAAGLLGPAAALSGERLLPGTPAGWAVLAGLALLSHVGGQGLIAWALAHLRVAFSAVGLLIQPVAAAVFAWLLLGETLGWLQGLGGVVVLAGIVLCRLAQAPHGGGYQFSQKGRRSSSKVQAERS